MTGNIPICRSEQFLQCFKVGKFVNHKHAHNPQPDAVVECFIDIADDILHLRGFRFVFSVHPNSVDDMKDSETESPKIQSISHKLGSNDTQNHICQA